MKKIFLILAVTAVTLTSCSDYSSNTNYPLNHLFLKTYFAQAAQDHSAINMNRLGVMTKWVEISTSLQIHC
jgi:hypothetical protein